MAQLADLLVKPVGEPFTLGERQLVLEASDSIRNLEERLREAEEENLRLSTANRALSEMSSRDALTGLYSRWYVLEKIEREISRAQRHGSPLSVLMVDIDHFKRINDTFGHLAGDEVLRSVGHVLKESCRNYDIPGRYGGEEFCVLLPETKIGNTTPVAERIRQRLEMSDLHFGDRSLVVTASFGIAGVDDDTASSTLDSMLLVHRADVALYHAKEHGRNRIEVWDSSLINGGGTTEH